ncbi:hypothetical protein OIU78_004665 [Salix suchowensis]|nr:hypothetical protein OIU78_004665 [Salix suchowensis]
MQSIDYNQCNHWYNQSTKNKNCHSHLDSSDELQIKHCRDLQSSKPGFPLLRRSELASTDSSGQQAVAVDL